MCGYEGHCGRCNYSSGQYGGLEKSVSYLSQGQSSYSSSGMGANYSSAGDISYLAAEAVSMPIFREYVLTDSKLSPYTNNGYQSKPLTVTYAPAADIFLLPERTGQIFAGEVSQIKEIIEEAFNATTGRDFPKDVMIRMLEEREFRKYTNDDNILGFAVNRKNMGLASEIFIKKGELAKIMLTIGHELGHVLSRKLNTVRDEEAKAFAFSLAWMKAIKENNIGNLSTAIRLDPPAKNGLHDVALEFVLKLARQGIDAIEIYNDLISKDLAVDNGV